MSDRIKLHPEYGLNPSMIVCFWCGEPTRGIVLLGNSYKGEAPRYVMLSYDPCGTCRDNMSKGITVIECTEQPNKRTAVPIVKVTDQDVYPTSRWCVIKKDSDAIEKLCGEEAASKAKEYGKVFVAKNVFEKVFLPAFPTKST
jgi:hypothetical protein